MAVIKETNGDAAADITAASYSLTGPEDIAIALLDAAGNVIKEKP